VLALFGGRLLVFVGRGLQLVVIFLVVELRVVLLRVLLPALVCGRLLSLWVVLLVM
jgi:hypothetical protein